VQPLRDARQRTLLGVVVVVVVAAVLGTALFVPLALRAERPLSTNEVLRIDLIPQGVEAFSVWLPVLLGSPFADPSRVAGPGATVSIVEVTPGRPFLNITATGLTTILVTSSFSGELNESYLDYEWSAPLDSAPPDRREWVEARVFGANDVAVRVQFTGSSDFCVREDELWGVLQAAGSPAGLFGRREAVCQ